MLCEADALRGELKRLGPEDIVVMFYDKFEPLRRVLFARAAYGFARRWPATAKSVGLGEIAFGALNVAAAAAGVVAAGL